MSRRRRAARDEAAVKGNDSNDSDEPVSKSQRKRDHQAVQALVTQLAALPETQFATLPLDDDTRDAIAACRDMSRGARKRQVKFAATRLAAADLSAITAALDALERPARDAVRAFHATESWRDRLVAADATVDEALTHFPAIERTELERLVREAREQAAHGRPPRAARALFRLLAHAQGTHEDATGAG